MYSKYSIKVFFLFLLIYSLLLKVNIEAHTDLVENTRDIEEFFRTILLETESGYTLYGEKPLSICDFPMDSQLRLGEKKHNDLTTILSFKKILKFLGDKNKSSKSNYFIRFSNENNFLLTIINRSAFLHTVQENLVLFRDRFGVDITPESFLRHVLDPDVSLNQLFNKNRAVLGILLGYGTKNSLVFERFSTLTEPLYNIDRSSPPYQLLKPGLGVEEIIQIIQQFNFTPSIAYESISEELEDIYDRFDCTTNGLPTSKPFIRFSFLKNDPDSEILKRNYRLVHHKIHQILDGNQLIDEFFRIFHILPDQIMHLKNHDNSKISHELIAQYLWMHFSLYDLKNMDLFIKGLNISGNNQSEQFFEERKNNKYFKYVTSFTATPVEKYESYNLRMDALKVFLEEGPFVEIVPNKIYYRILNEGRGRFLTKKSSYASFKFILRNFYENSLLGTYSFDSPKELDLSKIIPGFAYGILGMKIGEKREIFIDPDFAYGNISHSNYSAGLIVCAELVDFKEESEFIDFPDLFPVDFFQLKSIGILQSVKDVESFRSDSMIFKGITAWDFYKNLNVNLEPLIIELKNIATSQPHEIDLEKIVDINKHIYKSL